MILNSSVEQRQTFKAAVAGMAWILPSIRVIETLKHKAGGSTGLELLTAQQRCERSEKVAHNCNV